MKVGQEVVKYGLGGAQLSMRDTAGSTRRDSGRGTGRDTDQQLDAALPSGDFPARRIIVLLILAVATTGLMWRVVDLQLTHHDFLQSQGDARHLRVVSIPAHRGKVLDRNGEALAISTPVDSVWANPRELITQRNQWPQLSQILGLDPQRFARLIESRKRKEFIYLRRHVQPELASQVLALEVRGVHLRREYRRYYPRGEAVAHVVGFTNVDDEGQEGIELAYERSLRGVDGSKRVLRDRIGRVVEDVELLKVARPGKELYLSIDARVQHRAYRALLSAVTRRRARGGSAIVLDVHTGEVIAMVNQPSYNPNNGADRVSARFRNRAVTDVFEPGSTIKPFTIAAALETGRFRPDTRLNTAPGSMKVGRHTIKDVRNHGEIDLATIIKKSSNVGAAKVALSLEPKELWQTFSRVGFGNNTGTRFPGESEGVLTHFFNWGEIERTTLSFGYGLSVTTLQLAQAYAVLANGGLLPRVSFLRVDDPPEKVRVVSAETSRHLRWMLEAVVGAGGTGRRAQVPGYRVGGKTGTVRKSIVGGYSEDRYLAIFAGMAPLSDPRYVAVVIIDEPSGAEYYGGQVAAPVFAKVMGAALRTFGVAPDDRRVVDKRIALGLSTAGVSIDKLAGMTSAGSVGPVPQAKTVAAQGHIGETVR